MVVTAGARYHGSCLRKLFEGKDDRLSVVEDFGSHLYLRTNAHQFLDGDLFTYIHVTLTIKLIFNWEGFLVYQDASSKFGSVPAAANICLVSHLLKQLMPNRSPCILHEPILLPQLLSRIEDAGV